VSNELREVKCFLDKERVCDDSCRAFNGRSEDCKLLERSAVVARSLKAFMHWVYQPDAPKIR